MSTLRGCHSIRVKKWCPKSEISERKCVHFYGYSLLKVTKAGKVKIKKGTKKGIYKIKVKVTVAANKTYKAGTAVRTIKVKIK